MNKTKVLQKRHIFWIEADYKQSLQLIQKLVDFLTKDLSNFFSTKQILWFNAHAFEAKAPVGFSALDELKEFLSTKSDWRLATNRNLKNLLGANQSLIIFDAFGGFDPNALLLLTGALKEGATFVLLTPKNWEQTPDLDYQKIATFPNSYLKLSRYFLTHLSDQLKKTPHYKIKNSSDLTKHIKVFFTNFATKASKSATGFYKPLSFYEFNQEQKTSIKNLQNMLKRAYGSILISGIRGSGKSSLTAFALADFILTKKQRSSKKLQKIALIAANKKIALNFMQKFKSKLNIALSSEKKLINSHKNLSIKTYAFQVDFFAPDAQIPKEYDWAIIEEAATFSANLIKKWLERFKVTIFITTQDGYEGSNNSFKVNLQKFIDTKIYLEKSFRFDQTDAIAKWLNRSFFIQDLKNLTRAQSKINNLDKNLIELKFLTPQYLLENTCEFQQIFSLLASAHYRTRPSDIRQILDAPDAKILVAFYEKKPVGVAFCLFEGNLPKDILNAIAEGSRRLKGHLMPQSLALKYQEPKLATLNYLRISRIAVDANFRRKKLASTMLNFLETNLKEQLDALATSFAAKPENTKFWFKNNFILINKGAKIEKTSGLISHQMLKPLNKKTAKIFELLR